jgi:hypothetical protein
MVHCGAEISNSFTRTSNASHEYIYDERVHTMHECKLCNRSRTSEQSFVFTKE